MKLLIISLVAAIAFLLIGYFTYEMFLSRTDPLEKLPNPDLTGVERQVAKKIRTLVAEVRNNPNSAAEWGQLAMTLDVHDLKLEAVTCYKQAAALDPNEFRWPYYCAVILDEMGFAGAFKWFQRSEALMPDYAPMLVKYGQALFDAGHLDSSRQAFQRTITADSSLSHPYLGLARIELSEGKSRKSLGYLLKASELDPQHREIHGLLAEVYRRLNQPQRAAQELELVKQLPAITAVADPLYEDLVAKGISAFWYRERGLVYQAEGNIERAISEFLEALILKPDPEGHNYVGKLLHGLGKYAEATQQYRAAISISPNYVEAYVNLGKTLYEIGQTDQAIFWIERALTVNPGFSDAYLNLGILLQRSDRTADAIEVLRQGLTYGRDGRLMAMRLAWLLSTTPDASLRDGKEAVRLAELVRTNSSSQDPEVLDVLAAAYAELGDFQAAFRFAMKANELALSEGQSELASQILSRIKIYESNRPYRE